ncbi:MAG: hypothetical protein A3B68_09440 [Candidatus Melainabacteria bacterium RIFCSPHIGHO2_02_FULL_34_12]|nr:MAG: hypothetical protein A3B68_09440 [Candidatus Melainabacteria bacterium RIFCSPHIGHO2_02_FULL_34_12]
MNKKSLTIVLVLLLNLNLILPLNYSKAQELELAEDSNVIEPIISEPVVSEPEISIPIIPEAEVTQSNTGVENNSSQLESEVSALPEDITEIMSVQIISGTDPKKEVVKEEIISGDIEFTGELLVIYKPESIPQEEVTSTSVEENDISTFTSERKSLTKSYTKLRGINNTSFDKVLNSAVNKIKSTKNEEAIRARKTYKKLYSQTVTEIPANEEATVPEEATATIENYFPSFDTYLVKPGNIEYIDDLKKALESEPGVEKVIKDIKLQLHDVEQSSEITVELPAESQPQEQPILDEETSSILPDVPLTNPSEDLSVSIDNQPQEQSTSGEETSNALVGPVQGNTNPILSCQQSLQSPTNDPYFLENWHYERTGLKTVLNNTCNCPSNIPINECNIKDNPQLCNLGDENLPIAILDTGFSVGVDPGTFANVDVADRFDINLSRSVIPERDVNDFDGSDEDYAKFDQSGNQVPSNFDHGTACALSAAANINNNTSHAGILQNSMIWGIRVGTPASLTFSSVESGLQYVIDRVQERNIRHFVINVSIGDPLTCNQSGIDFYDSLGETIRDLGGLLVVSAGNEGCFQKGGKFISKNNNLLEFLPIDYGPNVFVVGAAASGNACTLVDIAKYSNYGFSTDIFAPGNYTVNLRDANVFGYSEIKQTIQGTSFASPSIAGYAGLLWSIDPTLTPDQVENILKVSAYNSLNLFNDHGLIGGEIGNLTSHEVISKSQGSFISFSDAFDLRNDILSTTVTPAPNTYSISPNRNFSRTIMASKQGSSEELLLEAVDLPSNASFSSVTGTSPVQSTFSFTPQEADQGKRLSATFLVKNISNKVIGYTKLNFYVLKLPISNAGPDLIANKGVQIELNGGSSFDQNRLDFSAFDFPINSYTWTQVENGSPTVTLENNRNVKPTFTVPDSPDIEGASFVFNLTVRNTRGGESSDTVEVRVNRPPVSDAGLDGVVNEGATVKLDGLSSLDLDGQPLTYNWSQIENGTPGVTINDSNSAIATFIVPAVTTNREFIFELKVKDPNGLESTDTVKLKVNSPPTSNAGLSRNVKRNARVILVGSGSDPDGDTLTYTWIQTLGPSVILTGANTLTPSFISPITSNTVVKFRLTVSDGFLTAQSEVSITTTTLTNRAPVSRTTGPGTVGRQKLVILNGSTSSDPDGDILTYIWTQTSGPSVILTRADTSKPSFTSPNVTSSTTLKFKLKVSDGALSHESTVTVIATNRAPVVKITPTALSVTRGKAVTLNGSTSSDPDKDTLTYSWTQISGTPVTLSGADTSILSFTSPSVKGALKFRLSISDGLLSAKSDVTVTVTNKAPVAKVIAPSSVIRRTTVTLDGSTSSDPDKDTLTYSWTAPAGIVLSDLTSSTPTFVAPQVTKQTTYKFTLKVSDGLLTNSKSVNVIVKL